jgi:hypothetical protein
MEIDSTLTYSENKAHLMKLVPDFDFGNDMNSWKAAEEEYLKNHFLSYYFCLLREGQTKSELQGDVDRTPRSFSLLTKEPFLKPGAKVKEVDPQTGETLPGTLRVVKPMWFANTWFYVVGSGSFVGTVNGKYLVKE